MDHQTVALVLKGTFGIGLSVHNGKTSQNVLTIFVMEVSLYLGMADLLFYKFGFGSFAYGRISNRFTRSIESKPVKQETSCTTIGISLDKVCAYSLARVSVSDPSPISHSCHRPLCVSCSSNCKYLAHPVDNVVRLFPTQKDTSNCMHLDVL